MNGKRRLLNNSTLVIMLAAPLLILTAYGIYTLFNELFLFLETLDDWIYYLCIVYFCLCFLPLPPPNKKCAILMRKIFSSFIHRIYSNKTPNYQVIDDDLNTIINDNKNSPLNCPEIPNFYHFHHCDTAHHFPKRGASTRIPYITGIFLQTLRNGFQFLFDSLLYCFSRLFSLIWRGSRYIFSYILFSRGGCLFKIFLGPFFLVNSSVGGFL
ncbi:MAG: hypothetical protein ACTSRS_10515 [Candidatus Helarchaeota archaeon]